MPLAELGIHEELAARVIWNSGFVVDDDAHLREHSIEVELPVVRRLLPAVSLRTIMVRPEHGAT